MLGLIYPMNNTGNKMNITTILNIIILAWICNEIYHTIRNYTQTAVYMKGHSKLSIRGKDIEVIHNNLISDGWSKTLNKWDNFKIKYIR